MSSQIKRAKLNGQRSHKCMKTNCERQLQRYVAFAAANSLMLHMRYCGALQAWNRIPHPDSPAAYRVYAFHSDFYAMITREIPKHLDQLIHKGERGTYCFMSGHLGVHVTLWQDEFTITMNMER